MDQSSESANEIFLSDSAQSLDYDEASEPSLSTLTASKVSHVCVINNTAVELAKHQEYKLAERKLRQALEILERDGKTREESLSPVAVVDQSAAEEEHSDHYDDITCSSLSNSYPRLRLTYKNWTLRDTEREERGSYCLQGTDPFPELSGLEDSESLTFKITKATLLYNIARVCHNQQNYETALTYYGHVQELIGVSDDETLEKQLFLYVKCGQAAAQLASSPNHSLESLCDIYQGTIDRTQELHGSASLELALCLVADASFKILVGSFSDAIQLLLRSISVLIETPQATYRPLGVACTLLGQAFSRCDCLDEALAALGRAQDVLQPVTPDEGSEELAFALFSKGEVYHEHGNFELALEHYQKAHGMYQTLFGASHESVYTLTISIARVYCGMKNLEDALQTYRRALQMSLELFGPEHVEVSTMYNRIGNLHFASDDLESAKGAYHDGLAIEQKILTGSERRSTVVTLRNLGDMCEETKECSNAYNRYREALCLQEQFDCHPLDKASTLNRIGCAHYRNENFAGACDALQKCLSIYREVLGDWHHLTAQAMGNVASSLHQLGKTTLALELYRESYCIQSANGCIIPDAILFSLTCFGIGRVFKCLGHYCKAITYFLRATRSSVWYLAVMYMCVADCFYLCEDWELSLNYFKKALSEYQLANDSRRCAAIFEAMGNAEFYRGNLQGFMEYRSQALRIYNECREDVDGLDEVEGLDVWRFDLAYARGAGAA